MSWIPVSKRQYNQESKKTRPNPTVDKTLRKVAPKVRMITCPRLCQQHTTSTGRLYDGKKSYDPVRKHCYMCGLQK